MYTKQCLTHSNTYCGQDNTFGDGESLVCEADDIKDEWGRVEDRYTFIIALGTISFCNTKKQMYTMYICFFISRIIHS